MALDTAVKFPAGIILIGIAKPPQIRNGQHQLTLALYRRDKAFISAELNREVLTLRSQILHIFGPKYPNSCGDFFQASECFASRTQTLMNFNSRPVTLIEDEPCGGDIFVIVWESVAEKVYIKHPGFVKDASLVLKNLREAFAQ